jgi:monoamine oxidase
MARPQAENIIVIGAGAAGLMAARELARAGKRVTILEARDRYGGRIDPLPSAEFGYPAEGGAEFVHGEAPVTRRLLREAGLSTLRIQGARWNVDDGVLSRDDWSDPHADQLHKALMELRSDMTVAQFLQQHFVGQEYAELRTSILGMVEGYDAADPHRASVLALRDEWMDRGDSPQGRIAGGYQALVDFLVSGCRKNGVTIRLGVTVTAIEASDGGGVVHCADGDAKECDAVILTVPIPLLKEIELPAPEREKAEAAATIGFGNVIKILLRFETRWWLEMQNELADLTFLFSDATIPVWWTQHPADFPVLTGWRGGPKTDAMAHFDEYELIEAGIASLAEAFGLNPQQLMRKLVAARAINWSKDPFARGAYSYATVETRKAQSTLSKPDDRPVLFSGEALYRGRDMGTVEAALASGLETARTILEANYSATP